MSTEQALLLLREADLIQLGQAARTARFRHNPRRTVTYVVDRNINYTNTCVSGCKFCAFYRAPGDAESYVLEAEEFERKLGELVEVGGTTVLLQGGLHPSLDLSFYEGLLRRIEARKLHAHCFSPPEIVHLARRFGLSVEGLLIRLRSAGLDTIPGGGAEILDDEIRSKLSPRKCTTAEWLDCMRTAHKLGMRTTATMVFGHIETLEHRVGHLARLRDLQDETAGFTAFICWTFQPENTALGTARTRQTTALGPGESLPFPAGGQEYLRMLAVSRLFLDNFPHVQASWVTQGPKIAQLALEFGADDIGSTMLEENVVRAAGCEFRMTRAELERLISDAGYLPRQRDCLYNPIE